MNNKKKQIISLDGKQRKIIDDKGFLRFYESRRIVTGNIDSPMYSKKIPFEYTLNSNVISSEYIYKYPELREICQLLYDNNFAYIYFCIGTKIYCYTSKEKLSFVSALGFNFPIAILGGKIYTADKIYLRYFFSNEDIVKNVYLHKEEKERHEKENIERQNIERRKWKENMEFQEKILRRL